MKQQGMRQVSCDTEIGKFTSRLSRVGCETTDLVVGVHDGLRLRCALHEGLLFDTKK